MTVTHLLAGNDLLHLLTSSGYTNLRVDLEDFGGVSVYAEYATFTVGDAASNYTMHCSGYSGNAGKSMRTSHVLLCDSASHFR